MRRILCLLLMIAGCRSATPPLAVVAAAPTLGVLYVTRVRPLERWAQVYHEVERCTGLQGHFASVGWYLAPHPMPTPEGGITDGWWRKLEDGRREIILVVDDTLQVRHEILHDVLWVSGWRPASATDDGHPAPPFGRCAVR